MEEFDNQDIIKLTEDFKEMIEAGESRYFDSDEMELIIDDFFREFEFEWAGKAIEYAISLFPSISFFRILKVKKLILELRINDAEKELLDIELNFPPTPEFYLEKVLLIRMTGSDEDTFNLLEKAYLLDNEDPEIHFMLAYEYLKKKDLIKAINFASFALKEEEAFDDQLFTFSYLFEETKQYEDALFFYTAIAEKFPLLKGGWFGLGLAYSWLSEFQEAIQAYELVLSLDPGMATAHFNMANSYYEMKDFDSALEHYQASFAIDNLDYNSLTGIGDCYISMGLQDEALIYYHKAIELNPNHQDAIMGIISILQLAGKMQEAQVFIDKIFSTSPQSFELLFSVIDNYDPEEQIKQLDKLFLLTVEQIENKEDFFLYFVTHCCMNELYHYGFHIINNYKEYANIGKMVSYYLAAFSYLEGNIATGNQFLQDALLLNYDDYQSFLMLDPLLSTFSEILDLIELYRPL